MNKRLTSRGFQLVEFTDTYGSKCTLQESSNVDPHIWFGVDEIKGEIMTSDAHKLGIPTASNNGWQPFPIPKEVNLNNRMHLSQEQVQELLPLLQYFAEHGQLPE